MKLSIGNDHRGYNLKKKIIKYLEENNLEYVDFGSDSENSADYPDYGFKVAKSVSSGESEIGILVCGSGIGMSMVANKVKGIRAALCYTKEHGRLAKEHNNANILILSEETTPETTVEIIEAWLNTKFNSDERYRRRVRKIHDLTGL